MHSGIKRVGGQESHYVTCALQATTALPAPLADKLSPQKVATETCPCWAGSWLPSRLAATSRFLSSAMEPMDRTLSVKAGEMSDVSLGRLKASEFRKRSLHLSGGSRAGGSVAVVPRPPATFSRQTAFLKSPPNVLSVRIPPKRLPVLSVLPVLPARVEGLSAPWLKSSMLSRPTFPTPPSQRVQCMPEDDEDELFLPKLPLSSL